MTAEQQLRDAVRRYVAESGVDLWTAFRQVERVLRSLFDGINRGELL